MNGIVWGAKHLAREARWFDAAFPAPSRPTPPLEPSPVRRKTVA